MEKEMKHKTQFECMNKECNTVIIGPETRLDGISCPRCDGPVIPKPFEQHKRIVFGYYECLCCGNYERVDFPKEEYQEVRVCPKCNGAFVDKWMLAKYKQNDVGKISEPKLLQIELDNYSNTPKVFMNGAEIKGKISISFNWKTRDADTPKQVPNFEIVYCDKEETIPVIKTIAFSNLL